MADYIMYKQQGLSRTEIAAKFGIQPRSLSVLISKAARDGLIEFYDPAERLEYELAPLVVDNLKEFLIDKNERVTIETAKGIGLFKSHQAVKVENDAPPTVIALRFETIEPATQIIGGTVVGRPKLFQLPTIDVEPQES